jgi:hypothetical protein
MIGTKVVHIEYGWEGVIGHGSTDDELMVIWTEHHGASLWSPEFLRWAEPDAS